MSLKEREETENLNKKKRAKKEKENPLSLSLSLTFFPPESATTSSVCLDLDLALPLLPAASAAKAASRSVHKSGTSEASRNEASGNVRSFLGGGGAVWAFPLFVSSFLSPSSPPPPPSAGVFPMIESRSCLFSFFCQLDSSA